MGNGLIIIVVIIGILVVMSVMRDGTDTLKSEPLQSTLESSKAIIDAGKDIVNKFQDDENITKTGLIEVGKIPCNTDADCNAISECEYYKCICQSESCFLES